MCFCAFTGDHSRHCFCCFDPLALLQQQLLLTVQFSSAPISALCFSLFQAASSPRVRAPSFSHSLPLAAPLTRHSGSVDSPYESPGLVSSKRPLRGHPRRQTSVPGAGVVWCHCQRCCPLVPLIPCHLGHHPHPRHHHHHHQYLCQCP